MDPYELIRTPPHTTNNDMDYMNEFSSIPESILPEELLAEFNATQKLVEIQSDLHQIKKSNVSIKNNLRKQTIAHKKIVPRLDKLDQSVIRIEETLARYEQSQTQMLTLIQKLVESNTTSNKYNPRQVIQSNTNISEYPLGTTERPIIRSNREVSTIQRQPSIENTQQRPSSSIRFITNSTTTTTENHRNQTRFTTTTNELSHESQYSPVFDEIDKLRSEKNRGKIQIGQWCYEINVGTTDDAPALITTNDQDKIESNPITTTTSSTVPASPIELPRNQITSTSNLLTYPSSRHESDSIQLCLLHPFKDQVCSKTERPTTLIDINRAKPVIIPCGSRLPENARFELAMVFKSSKGCFFSVYKFVDEKGEYKEIYSRLITKLEFQQQRIELDRIKIQKRCNNNMKNGSTFQLRPYPSGEVINTEIDRHKDLDDHYNFKHIQLAVRIFQDDTLLSDRNIFYSNPLLGVPKIQDSDYEQLQCSTIQPCGNSIYFDFKNECPMEFLVKIPPLFQCTLLSGYKWLEISVMTENALSPIYSIDTGNGPKTNPSYIQMKKISSKVSFKLVKQTLSQLINNNHVRDRFDGMAFEKQINSSITYDLSTNNMDSILVATGFNSIHIQFRLLHIEDNYVPQPTKDYPNWLTWQSTKFTEIMASASSDGERIDDIARQQKRSNEVVSDVGQGLPVYKAQKV